MLLLLMSSLGLGGPLSACDGFGETTSDDSAGPGGSGAAGGVADGGGGTGATGATGGGGQGGAGGCIAHADCTDAANAQCNNMATCVPCTDSSHCEGVAGLPVCDGGTCVECMLGEEDACVSPQTCDLLQNTCVDVAPGSIDQCEPCANDSQCMVGHRCIPLEYEMQHHGYYCLEEPAASCSRPYVPVFKPSINAEPNAIYCGVAEDIATCEAVLALQAGWFCTTDGMCSMTLGGAEFAVPGAICRQLFSIGDDKCTYRCGTDPECPASGAGRFCGDESGSNPPDFCGGDTM